MGTAANRVRVTRKRKAPDQAGQINWGRLDVLVASKLNPPSGFTAQQFMERYKLGARRGPRMLQEWVQAGLVVDKGMLIGPSKKGHWREQHYYELKEKS